MSSLSIAIVLHLQLCLFETVGRRSGASPRDIPGPPRASVHRRPGGSVENDGLVAVQQYSIFDVPVDCAGKHDAFDVAAQAPQIVRVVAVVDALYVLLDARTG